MIRSIQQPAAADSSPRTTSVPTDQPTSGKSFADVHAAALTRAAGAATPPTASTGSLTPGPPTTRTAPAAPGENETWQPVPDQGNIVKIVSGPRAGQYINLGHGPRSGETFQVEQQNGKTVHVYGSGTDQQVVAAAQDDHGGPWKVKDHPPQGESWAPVAGHWDYADILGGKRDGYFVNTSGNIRDGRAFQIVDRGGHTFHVYGSGKHALWIPIRGHETPSSSKGHGAKGAKGANGTTGTSGGATTGAHGGIAADTATPAANASSPSAADVAALVADAQRAAAAAQQLASELKTP